MANITRTLVTGLAAAAVFAGGFVAAAATAAGIANAEAEVSAVHCHTVVGCTEGEYHHREHRAEDHARHELHRLEHGHVF